MVSKVRPNAVGNSRKLELTPEQVAAARAIGCAFFPATELQVQRLTMQQRIFKVEGKHYLLSRNGSYFETAGTLRALIAKAPPVTPQAAPDPEPAPAAAAPPLEAPPAPVAPEPLPAPLAEARVPEPPPAPLAEARMPEPSPAPVVEASEPEPIPAPPEEPAAPPVRRRRRSPTKPAAPVEAEASGPAEPEAEPAPPIEEQSSEAEAAAAPRRRAKAAEPRWKTAGLARRGRLKPSP